VGDFGGAGYGDGVGRCCEVGQDGRGAGEGVEADGVALLAGDAGVVGQDDRQAAVGAGCLCEARPTGGAGGGEFDAVGVWLMEGAGVLQVGVGRLLGLERDGGGEQAAIEFREDDVHGEVGGGEAAGRGLPGLTRGAG
jgi:hypothetical protein